jgi:hypothetical protein
MSVDVDDFKSAYLQMCKEQHAEIQESIVRKITEAQEVVKKGGGYLLNLSTLSFSPTSCGILAKLFAMNHLFVDIKFNDCSLPDDGVRALAYGLADNTTCKRLELKGNNIRGPAAESLGRMLRQNTRLQSVCMEWNALGLIENAFSVFCDGIAGSCSLLTLDLRSNQITHVGASELANALKRNTTLRTLDLRWNNIGLIGGRALLAALDHNKTLIRLLLAGNNIPADVLKAIDSAIARNADRAVLTSDHQTRQHMLSKEIQELSKSHRNELIQLMDKVDRQDAAMQQASRSATERICNLQETLDERKQQFNNIVTKLSMTESELALAESKVNELSRLLSLHKDEHIDVVKHHQNEIKREREERALIEARLNKELVEVNEKNFQLSSKVDELERRCRLQQEQMFELKESLAHQQAEVKLKQSQCEEIIQFERQKTKDAYRDAESAKAKEAERLRKEADEAERTLKERLQRAESQRLELEQELSRYKISMANERLLTDEQLASAKQRIRTEEDQRRSGLEEKMKVLQASRDELQTYAAQQASLVAELQSRNSQLAIDNESLRRRITDLQQELAGKNAELTEEVARVRLDLNARIERLENDRRSKEDLYSRITTLEKDSADAALRHRNALEERDRELHHLSDMLKQRETELRLMRDADTQRALVLQSAVQTYVSRSPFTATIS